MKARILFALLTSIILSTSSLFSQDHLIPTVIGSNIYPITFTNTDQNQLVLEFDLPIETAGNSTGWTITVGGSPASISGSPVRLGSPPSALLRITLTSSILLASVNAVYVSYDGSGTFTLDNSGVDVFPIIVGKQARNNWRPVIADFVKRGLTPINIADKCAVVTGIIMKQEIEIIPRLRNSIHYR
ncbi:MAG: hypothetical protein NT144_13085, partial [Bacteroidia bacterium]|nr:hypothetical protein [Bacteroidia bacterium]